MWPETFVEEGVLAVNVAAIRKALSDGEEAHSFIETVPRRGYRFVGDVNRSKGHLKASTANGPDQRKARETWGQDCGWVAARRGWLGWYLCSVALNF